MIWEGLTVPTLEGFTGFVPPQGDGTSHVMIMGEAPGELEARDSIPFHPKAPAGYVHQLSFPIYKVSTNAKTVGLTPI